MTLDAPSATRAPGAWRPLAAGAGLGVAGLLVDSIALPFLGPGPLAFRLGGVAVLVAFARLGTAPGLLAALLTFAAGLTEGSAGALGSLARGLEAWIVFRLYRRSGSLVFSAALYWSTLGWLLVAFAFAWLRVAPATAASLVVCQVLNGLLDALLAEALLGLEARRRAGARPLASYAAARLAWIVGAPTLMLSAVSARIVQDRLQGAASAPLLLTLGVPLASVLLAYGTAWRLGRHISSAIERIGQAARAVEAGGSPEASLLGPLSRSPVNEVRDLGVHFVGVLDALAHYDALTGLPSRKLLTDRLELAAAQALARRENFALLLVDLDRFRVVDRALGHALGNELLRRIAGRLKGCVGPGETVARVGGDEFALLIPRMGRMEDATETARKVMDAVKRAFILEGREVFVTASVGISLYPRDGQDADTLLKNATAAAYVAKEKGQDSYRRYTARITARDAQRLTIESGLRRALEQGGLLVHYQPIVGLQSGQVLAAEALVRWQRPDVGLVTASEFVPVAEASGLIIAIDSFVLRQACAEAKRWSDNGHRVRVAVNLSARQFQQPDLTAEVAHVLQETRLDPRLLEIEITEGGAMQDVERSVVTLTALRGLGLSIAVDDFGTGYSSLSYLKRLPVDRVKLDQSFVRDLTISSDDAAIASAVVAMAHSLDLEVVAEGVETEGQLAFLRRQGCDAMQGYLLSHPVPPEALAGILERGRLLPLGRD